MSNPLVAYVNRPPLAFIIPRIRMIKDSNEPGTTLEEAREAARGQLSINIQLGTKVNPG